MMISPKKGVTLILNPSTAQQLRVQAIIKKELIDYLPKATIIMKI